MQLTELQITDKPWFTELLRIIAGDQLLLACLCALFNLCAGKEGGYSSFGWGVWMPGLFHCKIADMHGLLNVHFGKPNCGNHNPGGLAFHNTQVNHLPIMLTSLPTFQVCCDLVFISLYAQVLHCLLLVSGFKSLKEYTDSINSWEALKKRTQLIFSTFTNPASVSELQWR